jgi:hypothetical protein
MCKRVRRVFQDKHKNADTADKWTTLEIAR